MSYPSIQTVVAIRQSIEAGEDFNGTAPVDVPVLESATYKHLESDAGGLFDLASTHYHWEHGDAIDLIGIELTLGGQSAWSLKKLDDDGNAVTIASGTTEASYIRGAHERFVLLYSDSLKLETTGASTALSALLKFEPHVPIRRL